MSKRFKKLAENKSSQSETFEKLISKVKKNCTTKFDESIDLNFQINNKQKKGEFNLRTIVNLPSGSGKKIKLAVVAEEDKQKEAKDAGDDIVGGDDLIEINLRTIVNLPAGSGKKIKVAVVCEEAKSKVAKDAGADIVGGDDFIEKIKSGELNFEKLICTPSMMIKLSKLGKILGPKGLMPNPKLGTVSENVKKAVSEAKIGQVELKNDKDGNVGLSLGKKSFSDENIIKNYNAIIETLEKEKSNNPIKGDLIKNIYVTSTMGVSYKLKLSKNI